MLPELPGTESQSNPSLALRPTAFHAAIACWPGLLFATTVAVAAVYIAELLHAPKVLCALLLGMAFNSLAASPVLPPGLDVAAKKLLRIAVALLGARIGLDQVLYFGWTPVAIVVAAVTGTILCGCLFSKLLCRPISEGLLSGGAVAICGASAALALSSVMPRSDGHQRFTLLAVVGVTTLSTVAMIVYPLLAQWLGLDARETSIFLGGSIHDVAQVVGAGFTVSNEVGEGATLVKLMRVCMLLPAVLVFAQIFRSRTALASDDVTPRRPPLIPGFLIAFVALAVLCNLGTIPSTAIILAGDLSGWLLLIAIAALGAKTSLRQLTSLGWLPIAMLVVETVIIALIVLAGLYIQRFM